MNCQLITSKLANAVVSDYLYHETRARGVWRLRSSAGKRESIERVETKHESDATGQTSVTRDAEGQRKRTRWAGSMFGVCGKMWSSNSWRRTGVLGKMKRGSQAQSRVTSSADDAR